jgi:hypothetical protein
MSYKLQHKQNKNVIGIFDEINNEIINQMIFNNRENINDYEIIEFTPTPNYIDPIKNIQTQLSNLDLIVPRIVEDIIAQIPELIIHQSKIDIIQEKELLREQLRLLSM